MSSVFNPGDIVELTHPSWAGNLFEVSAVLDGNRIQLIGYDEFGEIHILTRLTYELRLFTGYTGPVHGLPRRQPQCEVRAEDVEQLLATLLVDGCGDAVRLLSSWFRSQGLSIDLIYVRWLSLRFIQKA